MDNVANIEVEDPPTSRIHSTDAIFAYLTRLLNAPAPNSGAPLPGAVGEVIGEIAAELGLALSADPRIRATGNLAIEIGAQSDQADLLITAHMDRPSFRVLDLADGTLYPLCAIRVPGDGYSCAAIAVRYEAGRVQRSCRREAALPRYRRRLRDSL